MRVLPVSILLILFASPLVAALRLHLSTNTIQTFATVELTVTGVTNHPDPFDPAVADLRVELDGPDSSRIVVPAFFKQEYERRRAGQGGAPLDWIYPVGTGVWKARFTPSRPGSYKARVILRDAAGEARSAEKTFTCAPSSAKGFLRVARKDPRFLEFDNGEAFFPIGQNLAFIGQQQYVTLVKAEEIFPKLAANGANYLRVWTCSEDWALAIEARKSAWGRSWGRQGRLVVNPDDPARRCLLLGASNATQEVNPSHPITVRPETRYVVTGRVRAVANASVRLDIHGTFVNLIPQQPLTWIAFRHEFTTSPRDWRLGAIRFQRIGDGDVWLEDLSLKEFAGGAELLWEAEMNRPVRGFYNPLDCFLLDELLAAAERNGIYLQLCVLTRDLYMSTLTNSDATDYGRAIADAKKTFRYAIARWGASTSVAAWEYWNEMNPGLPTDRFYAELGEFLEQNDPYRHLRTTSTWGPSAKDCRHEKLDIADIHFYLRPADKPRLANEVDAVLERTRWLRKQAPNKPVHLGEFGLADDRWRITDDMRRIPDLSDVHNGLWASALSGASGTALFWWWERIDQRQGYSIYKPLSRFIADVPWNAGTVQALSATCNDEGMRVIGLRAGKDAWFWIFDSAAAWERVALQKQEPAERREVAVEVNDWASGMTRIEWWDTRGGNVISKRSERSAARLRLQPPPFRRDIACRIALE